jgi:hypothetical protein
MIVTLLLAFTLQAPVVINYGDEHLAANTFCKFDEDDLSPSATIRGTIQFAPAGEERINLPEAYRASFTRTFITTDDIQGASIRLTSGGRPVNVHFDGRVAVGEIANTGISVFRFQLDSDGGYAYTQYSDLDHTDSGPAKDRIILNFGYKIEGDGVEDYATVQIDVYNRDGST